MKSLLIGILPILLSSCHLISNQDIKPVTQPAVETAVETIMDLSIHGAYYLEIKDFSDDELAQEITEQQQLASLGDFDAQVHLSLLHSLQNSPSYNSYAAKSILNQILREPQSQLRFSLADLAFITLFKDQLNQQLASLQKIEALNIEQTKYKKQIEQQQLDITTLEQKKQQLQQQIDQLKKIESTIGKHGKR